MATAPGNAVDTTGLHPKKRFNGDVYKVHRVQPVVYNTAKILRFCPLHFLKRVLRSIARLYLKIISQVEFVKSHVNCLFKNKSIQFFKYLMDQMLAETPPAYRLFDAFRAPTMCGSCFFTSPSRVMNGKRCLNASKENEQIDRFELFKMIYASVFSLLKQLRSTRKVLLCLYFP